MLLANVSWPYSLSQLNQWVLLIGISYVSLLRVHLPFHHLDVNGCDNCSTEHNIGLYETVFLTFDGQQDHSIGHRYLPEIYLCVISVLQWCCLWLAFLWCFTFSLWIFGISVLATVFELCALSQLNQLVFINCDLIWITIGKPFTFSLLRQLVLM